MPAVIMRSRFEPGFVAVAGGEGQVGAAEVEFVQVAPAASGATTLLAVEKGTGRLVQAEFRARDGTPFVEDVVRVFTAYETVDGITVPKAWKRATGVKESAREITLDVIEANPKLKPDLFAVGD